MFGSAPENPVPRRVIFCLRLVPKIADNFEPNTEETSCIRRGDARLAAAVLRDRPAGMMHQKKRDEEDSCGPPTVEMNGANGATAASQASADHLSRRTRRSGGSSSGTALGVLLQAGLAITLFFALAQFFDPSVHQHHESDLFHHQLLPNPVRSGLTDFALPPAAANSHGSPQLRSELAKGRERILQLLEEAGVAKNLSNSQIERLPKWQNVSIYSS